MGRRNFYVYVHRDLDGNIFYVGKGCGGRATSTDRHPVWTRYVNERLGGHYTVDIVRRDLSEAEAEYLESTLISEYGRNLVNWINPGRQFDYAALEKFHKLRDANRRFVAETRPLESQDPSQAVRRYQEALVRQREYAHLTLEHGLVAELATMFPKTGEPEILNRLTMCLGKLGRFAEAIAEAERYFGEYPGALDLTAGKTIEKRIEKFRAKLLRAEAP